MPSFTCVPVDTTLAERFRSTGRDDGGNALRRLVSSGGTGFPCRHCLDYVAEGESALLGSYNLKGPLGIYWTPSPIFVHADACWRFASAGTVAPIVRGNALVSIRTYDADDQCVYDLGVACPGAEVDAPLARALADPRAAFLNIHTAKPGCLLCRVERC